MKEQLLASMQAEKTQREEERQAHEASLAKLNAKLQATGTRERGEVASRL